MKKFFTLSMLVCYAAMILLALGGWMVGTGMQRLAHRCPPVMSVSCTGPVCDAPTFDSVEVAVFEATGYAIGPPYASIVKSGGPVVNKGFMSLGDIEIFTVAVDPKVIPLGSILWIEGLGIGMATDTGRLIKGRRIDVCFRTMDEAWHYGRRNINVTLLKKGCTR